MLAEIDWLSIFRLSLIPIIGAFIGWLTNWVAIKMLFYPRQPKKILFVTFHGIFPKNKTRIANKLGEVVQRDLLSFEDIREKIQDLQEAHNVNEEISIKVKEALKEKVENMRFGAVIPERAINRVHKSIVNEIDRNLPKMIEATIEKVESNLNIREIVYGKVQAFSDERLERLLLDITAREFKFIEIIGAVLGFTIGIVQLILGGLL